MDNRFYNASRSVLTGALKTTRQLNKRQKDILGFIYSQAEFMHAPVYREHGSIAISSASLAQACRPAVSCMTALSIAYELENAGFIKIERANKGEKGVANRYTLTDLFFEWMKATNDEFKKDVDMDQDNELNRQIQSLQERVDELTHQLEEKDKRIAELQDENARLQARVDNAIKWWNETNGKMKALEAENAELKKAGANAADEALVQENKALVQKVAKLEEVAKDKHNKFMASNNENFAYRNKIGGLQDKIRELNAEIAELKKKYNAAVQEPDELKGADGMVTVEPGEPYKVMKVDEFMQELSSIKNKN